MTHQCCFFYWRIQERTVLAHEMTSCKHDLSASIQEEEEAREAEEECVKQEVAEQEIPN